MQYVFDQSALEVVKSYCAADTLFAFDFDGTLAPIVSDPAAVSMRMDTRQNLSALAARATTAIISGRKREDLFAFIPESITHTLGNHGAEGEAQESSGLERASAAARAWKEQLEPLIAGISGVNLEDKTYSLTLHYRNAPLVSAGDLEKICKSLQPPPRLVGGKCVINLVAPEAAHKGQALQSLLEAAGNPRAIYLGDDDNDEDVFALHDPRILSIRVGRSESSAARFYLREQEEIDRLLALCCQFMETIH